MYNFKTKGHEKEFQNMDAEEQHDVLRYRW